MGSKSKTLTLVVLSGGQDSTTCLAQVLRDNDPATVHAITFNYGQRHKIEVTAAQVISYTLGLYARHEIVHVPDVLLSTSPLLNAMHPVERYAGVAALPGGLEKTFVPMRNQLFLTLAANRAVALGVKHGAQHVNIVTGVSQEDYGGYPDCREGFISALEHTVALSLDDETLPRITIDTPLIHLTKCDTVKLSEAIPGARALIGLTHTCYNGELPPCGSCHACLLRAKGYAEAGVSDPLLARLSVLPKLMRVGHGDTGVE